MKGLKLYISTPSNIMFEGWSLGIPKNVIPIQKRQLEMGKSFHKRKIVNLLPYYKNLSVHNLSKKLKLFFPGYKNGFKKNKAFMTQKN